MVAKVIFKIYWNDICILTKIWRFTVARIWKGYKTGASNRCWRNTVVQNGKKRFCRRAKEELFYAALVSWYKRKSSRQFWRSDLWDNLNNYSEEVIKQYWVKKYDMKRRFKLYVFNFIPWRLGLGFICAFTAKLYGYSMFVWEFIM
jgi:hypothetical protein